MFTIHFKKTPEITDAEGQSVVSEKKEDCGVFHHHLCNDHMDGKITAYKTADEITFIILDLQIHKDTCITLKNPESIRKGMHLFYNSGSDLHIKKQDCEKYNELQNGHLYISLPKDKTNYTLCLKPNARFKTIVIQTNFLDLLNDNFCPNGNLPQNLENAKNGVYNERIQKKPLNNQMKELVNKCLTNAQEGLEKRMNLEAHCKELMALAIGTIGRYKNTYANSADCLSTKEKEAIIRAAEIMEEQYANPPLQRELAKMVGLNVNKLTNGFKLVYGCTINKYGLKIRMNKAKSLLLSEDKVAVFEVSERIGFNNTSYFIKKFKEEFGEYPGEYV